MHFIRANYKTFHSTAAGLLYFTPTMLGTSDMQRSFHQNMIIEAVKLSEGRRHDVGNKTR